MEEKTSLPKEANGRASQGTACIFPKVEAGPSPTCAQLRVMLAGWHGVGEVIRKQPGARDFIVSGERFSPSQMHVLLKNKVVCHVFNNKLKLMETKRETSHLQASLHNL